MDGHSFAKLLVEALGPYTTEKGWIAYTGLDAIKPGPFYIMGYNPHSDDANRPLKDCDHIAHNWSAYEHQCWEGCGTADIRTVANTNHCDHLKSTHQKRVIDIISLLGKRPTEVFSANAIFAESKDVHALRQRRDFRELWEACWNVHEAILQRIKPKLIICLGNSKAPRASSFQLLREKAGTNSIYNGGETKHFEWKGLFNHPVRVVGIRHPSRFKMSEQTRQLIQEAAISSL